MSFSIEMLPAEHGDSFWVEWGSGATTFRALIDVGRPGTVDVLRRRISMLAHDDRHFELLVLTHLDIDHIGGAVGLMQDDELGASFGDVWFNGYRHLPEETLDSLGPVQGELLTSLLVASDQPWNEAFDGRAVMMPDTGILPRVDVAGDLSVTILSPGARELAALKPRWSQAIRGAQLDPVVTPRQPRTDELPPGIERLGPPPSRTVEQLASAPFVEDRSVVNGSSIALLLEFNGKRALFAGDAHPRVLKRAVGRISDRSTQELLHVDAFVLPHHGSRHTLSNDLLTVIRSRRFLVSTDGHHYQHPDPEAIARVLLSATPNPRLFFNYQNDQTETWAEKSLQTSYGYEANYPSPNAAGIRIAL